MGAQEGEEIASLGRWRHVEALDGAVEVNELGVERMVVVALPI